MEFKSYAKLSQEDVQATQLSKSGLKNLVKTKAKVASNIQVDLAGKTPRLSVTAPNGSKSVAYAGDFLLKHPDGSFTVESKDSFKGSYVETKEAE